MDEQPLTSMFFVAWVLLAIIMDRAVWGGPTPAALRVQRLVYVCAALLGATGHPWEAAWTVLLVAAASVVRQRLRSFYHNHVEVVAVPLRAVI